MAINFEDITSLARDLESSQAERNTMFQELEKMYLLEADDLPSDDWIKETISPDARNSLMGMVRLMSATEPKFSVPSTSNTPTVKKLSSKIEKAAAAIWRAVGRISGRPLQTDACLSALLYGEIQLTVISTKDLLDLAENDADKRRRERVAKQTPLMFEVINPGLGYPVWDLFGLRAYYSKRRMSVAEIRGRWGEEALTGRRLGDEVDYHDYWDLTYHAVWAEGEPLPFLLMEHKLPAIPVIAVVVEGGKLFYRAGQQTRQPALYTLWKSNLWKRQNLALTVMYSLIYSIGANPIYMWQRNDPDKEAPVRDFTQPGGLIILDQGENFTALAKQVIDPSVMQGLEVANNLGEQSTIYKQTLGESLGSGATFSMTAMLSQAGRLPLVPYQRMASHAIAQAMLVGFMLLKSEGGGVRKIQGEQGLIDFDPKEIPDNLDLEATLDVSLPQDDRQMAAVAAQLTGGEKPLVSQRYARERWLNIGQSDDMDQEILEETWLQAEAMTRIQQWQQQQMMQFQQQMQQAQQPQPGAGGPPAGPAGMPMPAGPGGPGGAGQGMPQGMPPDLAAQMQGNLQGTGAGPGLPGMMAGAPMEPGAPGGPMPGGDPMAGMMGG